MSFAGSSMARKSRGRQKLEMKKIAKESNLMVTFSKRRSGLFKKASELTTLCGAEVAIIVFSPANKVFSFGNPSVDTILDRFLTGSNSQPSSSTVMQFVDNHRNARNRDLNMQLTQVLNQLELENKRGKEFDRVRRANIQAQCWWQAPIEELSLNQLEQLNMSLEDLRQKAAREADKFMMIQNPNPMQFFTPTSNLIGNNNNIIPFETNNNGGFNTSMIPFESSNNIGRSFNTSINNIPFDSNNNGGFNTSMNMNIPFDQSNNNGGFNTSVNIAYGSNGLGFKSGLYENIF